MRGFNKTRKHDVLRHWLVSSKVKFGCLLETRVNESKAGRICSYACPGWSLLTNYEHHRLGRIWVVWSDEVLLTPMFKSSQVITCSVSIPSLNMEFFCSFVYASNFESERRELWADLCSHSASPMIRGKPWIILGDFNETLFMDEHSALSLTSNGMRDFQEMVAHCSLVDLKYHGPKLTWSNSRDHDPIAKKLDRALISDTWLLRFPQSFTTFEAGGISDHLRCHVRLVSHTLSGRKPFKFFNMLVSHPLFLPMVKEYWDSTERLYESRATLYRFTKKLKELKQRIRWLNREKIGDLQRKSKETYDELCLMQAAALASPSPATLQAESLAMARWTFIVGLEEAFYKQKAKVQWLSLGDQNNKFFHRVAQANVSKNAIHMVQDKNGRVVTRLEEIKVVAEEWFRGFLQEEPPDFTSIDIESLQEVVDFRVNHEAGSILIRPFTDAEIEAVLFSMPSNKAPGPDGYTKEFFQGTWPIIKSEFIMVIKTFFKNGYLPKGVNSTILALIPKVEGAMEIREYRPISCCNFIYKVISKLIANRLKMVLPDFILPNQTAFVQDRLLLENVLLATELVKNYHREDISSRCTLKIDIAKAFDTVQWDFLVAALRSMEFPDLFIRWIYTCISTVSFSVQVNGELAGFFGSKRGLRQGCALSPYLFVITMNVLSGMLNKAAMNGNIGYHPQCQALNLTHLCFADDIMIFTDGKMSSMESITQVFDRFGRISGLKINMAKSSIFLAGVSDHERMSIVNQFSIQLDTLPVRYLGLPLMTKRMSQQDYAPLIEKIQLKMKNWSTRFLSFAGDYNS